MASDYVELTRSAEPLQETLISETLTGAGVPFLKQGMGGMQVVTGGSLGPLSVSAFCVPQARLKEAKDLLCEHGIVCDVSERLLRRTFEQVVLPLIDSPAPDFERLTYLLEINNKETVRALFDLTALEPGGPRLLEDLFFHLAASSAARPALHALTRVVLKEGGTAFRRRTLLMFEEGTRELRLGLLEVLNEDAAVLGPLGGQPGADVQDPGPGFPKLDMLTSALADADPEVREAAAEALFFATKGQSYGYDPSAPVEDRETAIQRFLDSVAAGRRRL